jgi:hypothetical protein
VATELDKKLAEVEKKIAKVEAKTKKAAASGGGGDLDKKLAEVESKLSKAGAGGGLGESVPGVSAVKTVGGGILGGVVKGLEALQQTAFRTGSGVGELIEGRPGAAAGEFQKAVSSPLRVIGKGPEHLGFREATVDVKDRDAYRRGEITDPLANLVGEKAAQVIGTGADILLDPALPVGLGKAKYAKSALKSVEKVAGKETAEKIAKEGISKLAPKERASLDAALALQAGESAATGGRRSLAEIAKGVQKPAKLTAQEGAERTVAKTTGILEAAERARPATAVGRFAERAPSAAAKGVHLDQAVTAIGKTRVGQGAKVTVQHIEDAIVPRAEIARNYGKQLADRMKALGGEKLANVARQTGDVLAESSARVTKLGRKLDAQDNRLMAAALRGESWAVDTVKGSDLAEVFDFYADLEKKTGGAFTEMVRPPKGAKPTKLAAVVAKPVEGESFAMAKFREILGRQGGTPEGLVANQGKAADVAKAVDAAPPIARPTKSVDELTKTPISDDNPLRDVLNRHFQAIHEQEAAQYNQRLRGALKDPKTGESLFEAITDEMPLKDGWTRLKDGSGQMPKEIAAEVERVGEMLSSDKSIRGLNKMIDQYDRFWKKGLTSLPVSAAFTLRNLRSNLFLNWLDGVHTLAPYKEASQIQARAGQILKGEKYKDEIIAKGVRAVMKENMTPRQFKVWELADKRRVLGSNYFDIDLAFSGLAKAGRVKGVAYEGGKVKRGYEAAGEFGKRMNSVVEDNAKLANFIHNLDKYGNPDIAAEHVHKFLFDYGDLTPLEQRRIRKIVPFYTFMRKNVPLQVEQLYTQPGKLSLRLKAGEQLTDPLGEDDPTYLKRQQARIVPEKVSRLLGVAGDVVLSPETPLTAAAATVEPFLQLAAAAPSIARGKAPDSLKTEVFRPIVSMIGGARGVPIKLMAGEAAGVDLYTGAELAPDDVRDRLLNVVAPFAKRAQTVRFKTEEDRWKHVGSLIQQDSKPGETIQQFILRQAGIKTRQL